MSDYQEKKEIHSFEKGLGASKERFFERLGRRFVGKQKVTEEQLDHFEASLLAADVDLDTTRQLIEGLVRRVKKQAYLSKEELLGFLAAEALAFLPSNGFSPYAIQNNSTPHAILIVGINGVGKTTTAARLAYAYKQRGHSVCLGSADTFRAAAIDQLRLWATRLSLPLVAKEMGTDPSAVAYQTLVQSKAQGQQVAIIDTAGRLHTKKHLMDELSKLCRVMNKALPGAPHETLLVLDATTGQNAFVQAEAFLAATRVSGIVLTKLDGTAKGGVLLGVAAKYKIPICYVGMGEQPEDLYPFDPLRYVRALFGAPATG